MLKRVLPTKVREKSSVKDPSKQGFGFGSFHEVTNGRDPSKRVALDSVWFCRRKKTVKLVGSLFS